MCHFPQMRRNKIHQNFILAGHKKEKTARERGAVFSEVILNSFTLSVMYLCCHPQEYTHTLSQTGCVLLEDPIDPRADSYRPYILHFDHPDTQSHSVIRDTAQGNAMLMGTCDEELCEAGRG